MRERVAVNFEPQKFFIGLMGFFSILLPGALLVYLLLHSKGSLIIGSSIYDDLAGTKGWMALFVVSYLLGHIAFLIGALLDWPYDMLRRRTLNHQIRQLALRGRLTPWFIRLVVYLVFKDERDLAVERAGRIKRKSLEGLRAGNAINTFQWSKAYLNIESSQGFSAVERLEADSKFFRSFVIVLILALGMWFLNPQWPRILIPLVILLLLLALWRYMEQRYKATNQAYWSVITLMAKDGKVVIDKAAPANPTHAGGVVFRVRDGKAEYLLVEAKKDPNQWVLPKGHVEEGEQHRETAVREVHEETGVWARIVDDLGNATWSVDGSAVTTRFFLMESVGWGLRKDKDRREKWLTLPLSEAIKKASYIETRDLLQAAEQRRSRPASASPTLATSTTSN
jgi:ADP-ribose pyrophosphatase YjhB (NUDIX family)